MNDLTASEYNLLLRADFATFIERCFRELHPLTPFLWAPHLAILAAHLDACRRGEIKRLIINIPPRHLKSICASVALPAYWLGHDPSAQFLCVSYAQELADKHARDCRSVIQSPWYQGLFPTRLSPEKHAVHEFATTRHGFRLATSVSGVLTGRGGDVIVIDDPLKPDEALSDSQRAACVDWYNNTLLSRLNNKGAGCIIVVMQRLHEGDLSGHLLAQGGWQLLRFQAIAEKDETFEATTPLGVVRFHRRAGDVLHPERESQETLDMIRRTLGAYNFAGQYQQAPAPLGGGMVKEEWFKRYGPKDVPDRFEQIVQSWDTANKSSELNDYSVCTTWGLKDKRRYLLNVLRKRLDYPSLKKAVLEQAAAFDPSTILIEDKGSGTQLIQELSEAGVYAVTRFKPEGDKLMRLHAQTGAMENGFVYLPIEAHWLVDYLHELTTFPNGKFDDQVDSTSQFLNWTTKRFPGWGILEFSRQELERIRGKQVEPTARLKVPLGVTHIYTMTGGQIIVPEDRIVEIPEQQAKGLVLGGFVRVPDE